MKAIFNTRSNYRNLNGKELKVTEIFGTRVTALVPDGEHGFLQADFTLGEVVKFTEGVKSMPDAVLYPKSTIHNPPVS